MADIRAMRDQAKAMGVYPEGSGGKPHISAAEEAVGKILEFITVNVATRDLDGTLGKWRDRLTNLPAAHMPEPPAEITT